MQNAVCGRSHAPRNTTSRLATATVLSLTLVMPAWACERVADLTHEQLVRRAKVILRARAEGLGTSRPGPHGVFSVATQVRFRVLAVYKGALKGDVGIYSTSLAREPVSRLQACAINLEDGERMPGERPCS
jgi:hypothetical protein